MVDRADAERLRQAQTAVRRLVERDLEAFWRSLDLSRPERARDELIAFTRVLVASYGESAAGFAADWYDEVRAAARVPGRFRAAVSVPDEGDAVEGTVRRAAGALFTDNPGAGLSSLVAVAPKFALAGSRQTIIRSTDRDPRASGWQRVTRGGSCRFCRMLAGRGDVYRRSSVHFAAHDDCNCAAAPSWDTNAPEVDVDVYKASERTTAMTPAQLERHNDAVRRALDTYAPE